MVDACQSGEFLLVFGYDEASRYVESCLDASDNISNEAMYAMIQI